MPVSLARKAFLALCLGVLAGPLLVAPAGAQTPAAKRAMTFLDMQLMNQAGAYAPSPDRKWLLYTISYPDWKEARRQTDIHLVSLEQGIPELLSWVRAQAAQDQVESATAELESRQLVR